MRALLFDVFGTCVDWRGSVEREPARRGPPIELAVAWRALDATDFLDLATQCGA
jgi:2-haloacid dehalogenase